LRRFRQIHRSGERAGTDIRDILPVGGDILEHPTPGHGRR